MGRSIERQTLSDALTHLQGQIHRTRLLLEESRLDYGTASDLFQIERHVEAMAGEILKTDRQRSRRAARRVV
jgi:hypothetical protein